VVPDGKNPQVFNRYSYVSNNPVNHIDPSGHVECDGPLSDGVTNCTQATQADRRSADIAGYFQMVQYKIEHDTCCSSSWKYREEITTIANQYGIPPILLAAAVDHQSHSKNRGLPELIALVLTEVTGNEPEWMGSSAHSYGITQIRLGEFTELAGLSADQINSQKTNIIRRLLNDDLFAIEAMARKIQIADQRCSGCSESERYAVMAVGQNGWGPGSIANARQYGIVKALKTDQAARAQVLAITGDMEVLTARGWQVPRGVLNTLYGYVADSQP
jgi:hypothetical protein